jgi:hypothetical protein
MQLLAGEDNKSVFYEFAYVESTNRIICWKNKKQSYVLEVIRKRDKIHLACECWGQSRWGYCRHEDFCIDEFNFSKVHNPRTFMDSIKEEYYRDWLTLREGSWND